MINSPKTKDNSKSYTYPVTAATQSQKKNLEAKKFQPISRITKLVGRNSEKSLAYQASKNQDQLNNRTTWSLFFFSPPSEHKEIEDSTIIKSNSYGIRGVLSPGQDRQVQFDY